jgi:hypothetical protein
MRISEFVKKLSWDNWTSFGAAVMSLIALGVSVQTASSQSYRDRIDARISHCTSVADVYANQSWAYGLEKDKPDPNLAKYSHRAMAIARAAQLCRNKNDEIFFNGKLENCINVLVDTPLEHKVIEKGLDNIDYTNLVC